MATISIVVNSNVARNVTVDPTRVYFANDRGKNQLQWIPAGPTEITNVAFDSAAAPSTPPAKDPTTGIWTAEWNTGGGDGTWKYSIGLTVDGVAQTELDPEIENGPPG